MASVTNLAQIKSAVTVIDAHRLYTELQLVKHGRDYWALCPFHIEKTPSYSIYDGGRRWYCHGCHEGGDVIDLVRKLLGLSIPNAIKRIAVDFGLAGDARTILLPKPKQSAAQILRMQYFGLIDLLFLDKRRVLLELQECHDPDQVSGELVHKLGEIETLLDELLHGTVEVQADVVRRRFGRG